MKKIVIAIDGYSGCGKSSTAKAVASRLAYGYIDTGAMYRCVTLSFIRNEVALDDSEQVKEALGKLSISFSYSEGKARNEVYLNGENVEDEIRKMYVSDRVSDVAVIPQVRAAMVAQQRKMGEAKGVVMDGRDIGTVVFPDAELKVFMTSDVRIRAKRRQLELEEQGEAVDLEEIVQNFEKRDLIDSTREESPLRQAEGAVVLDTSFITFEEQVQKILDLAEARIEA
ncbi:MAG: (d)CMP kinase [Cytophagales bacterium]|nr:(d)CMP kinase [Cytophagales bacterium]